MATKNPPVVKLGPLADRVVVRSLEDAEQTRGGLFIPDTAKEKPQQGEIVAVGPGRFDEDEGRGYRTLARMLGVGSSLAVASVMALLAFLSFAHGLALAGPTPMARQALAFAGVVWGVVLVAWLVTHRRMTGAEHKRGMYRALAAWALTDVAVVVAFAV